MLFKNYSRKIKQMKFLVFYVKTLPQRYLRARVLTFRFFGGIGYIRNFFQRIFPRINLENKNNNCIPPI